MATADSVRGKIEQLISDSNAATGNTDADLTAAVNALIAGYGQGGDTSVEDAIITRTITEYSNDRVTSIGFYAFCRCNDLKKVNFPNVTTVGNNAFVDCTTLREVNLPALKVTNTNLFGNCTSLQTINLPSTTSLSFGTFSRCTSLTTVNVPACMGVSSNVFEGCTALTLLDFPSAVNVIWDGAFRNTSLTTLILRGGVVCALKYVNAFTNTPIESGTGYIYVPSAVIDTYKSATNWVVFADQFRALEDYTVDGTTTGELDESKVNA